MRTRCDNVFPILAKPIIRFLQAGKELSVVATVAGIAGVASPTKIPEQRGLLVCSLLGFRLVLQIVDVALQSVQQECRPRLGP